MNKKIIISLAVILVVVALSFGSTMAWFTDSVTLDNTFTAGTLDIDGSDYWYGYQEGDVWETVNPGDCKDKIFTINNLGSKNTLIRFQWSGEWGEYDESDEWSVMADSDPSLVTVTVDEEFADEWFLHDDGWFYYIAENPLAPGADLGFTLNVCVDGPGTGNEYQGKSFKLSFAFEAVQASNNASGSEWLVDSLYNPEEPQSAANWNGFDFDNN